VATGDGGPAPAADAPYILGSVVIVNENRTTYVQVVHELSGHFDNKTAVEIPGNGNILVQGTSVFAGLTEEPTWVRYGLGADGKLAETGRINFMAQGFTTIDYGNAIVDAHTAVSVSSKQLVAVVWDPTDLLIKGTVPLSHLQVDGYELEVWTTSAHDGKVYIPGRWANWTAGEILPKVSLTILDPAAMKVVGVAEDTRCASAGQPVFGKDGYAYVMGDGRTYSIQMYANAKGLPAPKNCLLRIAPGATSFDPAFMKTIPELTGGLESVNELETSAQGSGYAFTSMFYPDMLPAGVKPVDFDFWSYPVFKYWTIDLGDTPAAHEVASLPFATVGFIDSAIDGKLLTGQSPDGANSVVYELDPATGAATRKFDMDGLFYGLQRLAP